MEGISKFLIDIGIDVDSSDMKSAEEGFKLWGRILEDNGSSLDGFLTTIKDVAKYSSEANKGLKSLDISKFESSMNKLIGYIGSIRELNSSFGGFNYNIEKATSLVNRLGTEYAKAYDKATASERANSIIKDTDKIIKASSKQRSRYLMFSDDVSTVTKKLKESISTVENEIENSTVDKVTKKLKQQLLKLKVEYDKLNNELSIKEAQGKVQSGTITDPGNLYRYSEAGKKAWATIGSYADKISKKSWEYFKKSARLAVNSVKKLFTTLGTTLNKVWGVFHKSGNKANNALISQIKSYAMMYLSIYKLISTVKKSIDLSSDMIEVRNVIHGVFGQAEDDILNFTKTAVASFGLTELEANKMIGIFGGMLDAANVTGDANVVMSKNLTALAGDVASFYNMNVEEVFEKFQSGLSGHVTALRAFGINATIANLEAYAMANGIHQSWQEMSTATQQTLRYNYMLEKLVTAQGDFARTADSWANKVRSMSLVWQQFLSVMGGFAIKALYPVVLVLNQILNVALKAAQLLAEVFHVTPVDLENMFGLGANMEGINIEDTSYDTTGIDDYTDSVNDAVDATDDYAKSTEDAGDNLQSFDRLNNITTDSIKDSNKAKEEGTKLNNDDVNKMLGGSLIDPLSYFEKIEGPGEYVNEWLENWIKTLTDKRWYKAGNDLAKLISKGLEKVDNALSSETTLSKANSFGTGIGEFINGILDETETFNLAGKTLADGVNLFTTWFNALFDEVDFAQAGRDFNSFVDGFVTNVDADGVGKALSQKFRALIDFASGTLEDDETWTTASDKLVAGINSFIEGINLSESIPVLTSFIGRLFKFIGDSAGNIDSETLSMDIKNGINTAIANIDTASFTTSVSNILNLLLDIFDGIIGADYGKLGDKFGEVINGLVEDGSVKRVGDSLVTFIGKIIDFAISAWRTTDKSELIGQLWEGITEGIEGLPKDVQDVINGALTFAGIMGGIFIFGKIAKGIAGIMTFINAFGGIANVISGLSALVATGGPILLFVGAVAGLGYLIYKAVDWSYGYIDDVNERLDSLNDSLNGVSETAIETKKSLVEDGTGLHITADGIMEAGNAVRKFQEDTAEYYNSSIERMESGRKVFSATEKQTLKYGKATLEAARKANYADEEQLKSLEDVIDSLERKQEIQKEIDEASKHVGNGEYVQQLREELKLYENIDKYSITDITSKIRDNFASDIGALSTMTDAEFNTTMENMGYNSAEKFTEGWTGYFDINDELSTKITDNFSGIGNIAEELGKEFDQRMSNGLGLEQSIRGTILNMIPGLDDSEVSELSKQLGGYISEEMGNGVSASDAMSNAINELLGDAVDEGAKAKAEEIGEDLADTIYKSFTSWVTRNPLTLNVGMKVDDSELHKYTTKTGGRGIDPFVRTYSGAPTGYTYNAQSYDIATASAKSALGEYYDYAMRDNTFSAYASGMRSTYTPIYYDRTESYVSSARRNVSSYNEERMLNKLSGVVSNLNSMRGRTNEELHAEISIGNKQIDDYIVDVVRRNKYRLA